jgi:hypothetical protein
VVKSSSSKSKNILNLPPGVQRLSINEVKNVPVLMGEKDILKTIQLLPGIRAKKSVLGRYHQLRSRTISESCL